ncbi:MAG: beta-lactamase family protein [Acidobacteria bacterium]|nr:beta-lactamase family protein [Acidobacteriota bacterium]
MSTRRDFLKHGTAALAIVGAPAASNAVITANVLDNSSGQTAGDYSRRLEVARAAAHVTGASFAYWDGKTLNTAVAGVRNSVTGDPVTADTLMHVGSITKLTTAVLVMQLVDEGKIRLDDPAIQHLPDFRIRDMQSLNRITCAMLLNHTSGIDGEWLPEYGPDRERIVDAVERCADLDQLFDPGTETSYNNIAFVVAGYLAQKLRDVSWYTLVKTRIYEPLGMRHSLVDPLDLPRFRVSVGDLTDEATARMVQTTRPFLAPSFAPAGSTQMTTASDLVTFVKALIAGGVGANGVRILSAASATRMSEPTAEFVTVGPSIAKVGLGWMLLPGGVVGHGGGGPGVQSQVFAHPTSGRVAVLLTNCDKGDALITAFLDPIVTSWTGTRASEAPRRIPSVDLAPYHGTYENNADRYIILARDGSLALRTVDKISTYDNSNQHMPDIVMEPLGNDTFRHATPAPGSPAMLMRFVRPRADGKMRFLASDDRLLKRAE